MYLRVFWCILANSEVPIGSWKLSDNLYMINIRSAISFKPGLFPVKTRPLTKITSNNSSNPQKREKLENFENHCRAKMVKTKHGAMMWLRVPFGVKLSWTIKNNVLNTCAHFRCVSHRRRADTVRIVKFCANFIDVLRRDARGWDTLATRYRWKVKCFTPSNRQRRRATPRDAAMRSQIFEGLILRVINQKIGASGIARQQTSAIVQSTRYFCPRYAK